MGKRMTATNYETRKNIKKKKKFFHKKLPERKSFYNIFLQKINMNISSADKYFNSDGNQDDSTENLRFVG